VVSGGSQGKKVTTCVTVVENVETNVGKIDSLTATCQKHDNVIASGWPGGIVADLGDEITRFPFFNPNRSPIIT
jgi:hypothetical protein